MNLADTNRLLTFIALYDNRRIDDAVVVAWHAIVGELPFADSMTAVTRHFGQSTEYLMPVHIVRGAREIAREANNGKVLELPTDPRRLTDRSAEIQAFVRSIRDALPRGKPELIHRPRLADRKRGRKTA